MGRMTSDTPRISVIIPAYNEQGRVGSAVSSALTVAGVTEIIVVDDGSRDATGEEAARAGAAVIGGRHRGKGAALRRGIAAARGDLVLLLDADLGESAAAAGALVDPVRAGTADMAIGVLPTARGRGGFGLALGAARGFLWLLTGRVFSAPLSGQRCITAILAKALPWARGFGAEVAATTDAAAVGARIVEVPANLTHAATGRTLAGFIHRGRQLGAIVAACAPRILYPVGPTAQPAPRRRLVVAWCGWAILAAVGGLLHPWLFTAVGIAAFAGASVVISLAINHAAGNRRLNYQGREIPAAAGLGFVLGPWGACLAAAFLKASFVDYYFLLMVALAATVMAGVGLVDDLYGNRSVTGFAGHMRSLMRGRITTGAVKAIAGGAVGLGVGTVLAVHWLSPALTDLGEGLLNAVVIALTTNLVNLLDVRPGRALKGFVVLAGLAIVADPKAVYLVAPIGAIALAFAPLDFGGRAMMGDVGSNSLGMVAGIALAWAMPMWGKLVLAAALVGIHLYGERRSLSDFIARAPALRWLDALGRADNDAP
jgi:hypothetical protein